MKRFNLFDGELDEERTEPAGFTWRAARLGPRLGAEKVGASVYELQPGERSFPYHYEYGAEEWLIVVSGRPTLRVPDGEHELRAGDVVCFPEGRTAPTSCATTRTSRCGSWSPRRSSFPTRPSTRTAARSGSGPASEPIRLGSSGSTTPSTTGTARPEKRNDPACGRGRYGGHALPLRRRQRAAYAQSVGTAAVGGHPRSRVAALPESAV